MISLALKGHGFTKGLKEENIYMWNSEGASPVCHLHSENQLYPPN